MKPYENIVTFESMLVGYTDAVARFDVAAKAQAQDATATYNAAFEALNWAVALDDRVRSHWCPDGTPIGWGWRQRVGRGAEIMGGVRFARNSVHHQWSDALLLTGARSYPKTFPVVYFEWVWADADALPEPDMKPRPEDDRIYRQQMQSRPVRVSLDVLNGVFLALQHLLEPHTIPRATMSGANPLLADDASEDEGVWPPSA